jgi:hypothetical protein
MPAADGAVKAVPGKNLKLRKSPNIIGFQKIREINFPTSIAPSDRNLTDPGFRRE